MNFICGGTRGQSFFAGAAGVPAEEELVDDESVDAAGFDSDLALSEEFVWDGGLPFPFP